MKSRTNAPQRREPEIPRSWRVIAGTHAINEAFKVRPKDVKLLWLRQGWESSKDLREIEERAKAARSKIEVKPPAVLEKLCATHQGAIAYAASSPTLDLDGLTNFPTSVVLALDGLEDPHNLGA